jgi:enoyl-CoA hydratase/carnithine racemase
VTLLLLASNRFGWGLELAFACDLRIVAADATLCFPEASLGIFPGAGGTVLASRVLGPARAKEIIFTSKRFNGHEALAWGAANAVAADGPATLEEAMKVASRIARMGPLGVQAAKVSHRIDWMVAM